MESNKYSIIIIILLVLYPFIGFYYTESYMIRVEGAVSSGEMLYDKMYRLGLAMYGRQNAFVKDYNQTAAMEAFEYAMET